MCYYKIKQTLHLIKVSYCFRSIIFNAALFTTVINFFLKKRSKPQIYDKSKRQTNLRATLMWKGIYLVYYSREIIFSVKFVWKYKVFKNFNSSYINIWQILSSFLIVAHILRIASLTSTSLSFISLLIVFPLPPLLLPS